MPIDKPDYQCIRCGYKTEHKPNMKRHFYSKKITCQAMKNNIVLTPEICEEILTNRIYHISKNKVTINQQYNQIIINMNPSEKLEKILEYQQKKLIDFDNNLYDKYISITDKLENDQYKYGHTVDKTKVLDIIEELTSCDLDFDALNVLYDPKKDKVMVFRIPSWESYRIEDGIIIIIRAIKSNYLDMYEQYLIKKLALSSSNLVQYQKQLEDYYAFIACFELRPFVEGHSNVDLIGKEHYDEHNPYSLEEYYNKKYKEIKEALTQSDINRLHKSVINIVKKNGKCNIERLNKEIMNIINADNEFLQNIDNRQF